MILKDHLKSLIDEVIFETTSRIFESDTSYFYGHWIAPDGTMIDVSWSHHETAVEILRDMAKHHKLSKDELDVLNSKIYDMERDESLLYNKGWVRGVKENGEYYVNGKWGQKLTPKQRQIVIINGKELQRTVKYLSGGEGIFKGMETLYHPDNVLEESLTVMDKRNEKAARFFIYSVWRYMPRDDKYSPYQFSLWMDSEVHLQNLKEKLAKELRPTDENPGEDFFDKDIVPTLEKLEAVHYARISKKIDPDDPLFLLKNDVKGRNYESAKKQLYKSHWYSPEGSDGNITDDEVQKAFDRLYRHAVGETYYNKEFIERMTKLEDVSSSGDTTERLFVQHYAGYKASKFSEQVKVWRGTNSPLNKIKPGDYVTFDRDYASSYARGKFKAIVQSIVSTKDLRIDSMSIDDTKLVYWPSNHEIKKFTGTVPSFKEFWAAFR